MKKLTFVLCLICILVLTACGTRTGNEAVETPDIPTDGTSAPSRTYAPTDARTDAPTEAPDDDPDDPEATTEIDHMYELAQYVQYGTMLIHTDKYGRTAVPTVKILEYFRDRYNFSQLYDMSYVTRPGDEAGTVDTAPNVVYVNAECTTAEGETLYVDVYYDEDTDTFYSSRYAEAVNKDLYDEVAASLGLTGAVDVNVSIRDKDGLIPCLRDDVRTLADMKEKGLLKNCLVEVRLLYDDPAADLQALPRETLEKTLAEVQVDSLSLSLLREGPVQSAAADRTGYYVREAVDARIDESTGNITISPVKYGLAKGPGGVVLAFQEQYVNAQLTEITEFSQLPDALKGGDIYRAFRIDAQKLDGPENVSGGNDVREYDNACGGKTVVARYGVYDLCLMPGDAFNEFYYKDENGGFLYEGSGYRKESAVAVNVSDDDFTDGSFVRYFVFDNYHFD